MKTSTVRLDDDLEAVMEHIVDEDQITSAEVLRNAFSAYIRLRSERDEAFGAFVRDLRARRMAATEQDLDAKLPLSTATSLSPDTPADSVVDAAQS